VVVDLPGSRCIPQRFPAGGVSQMNQRPFHDAHQIPLARPWFDDQEPRAAAEVVQSGQLCQGPKTEQFEAAFAAKFGVRHAIAVSNGFWSHWRRWASVPATK
jgi:hypothetical protein